MFQESSMNIYAGTDWGESIWLIKDLFYDWMRWSDPDGVVKCGNVLYAEWKDDVSMGSLVRWLTHKKVRWLMRGYQAGLALTSRWEDWCRSTRWDRQAELVIINPNTVLGEGNRSPQIHHSRETETGELELVIALNDKTNRSSLLVV